MSTSNYKKDQFTMDGGEIDETNKLIKKIFEKWKGMLNSQNKLRGR